MRISDLPCDMESEILYRIPTKYLTKLQTVCKRWKTLFRDPSFVKKKLDKSAWEMIFLKNGRIHSINVNLLDPSMEFRGKLCILKGSKDVQVYQIFHCEGLLLFTTRDMSLMVCNPCTGEIRSIKFRNCRRYSDISVLGYEKIWHNYKILRVSEFYDSPHDFVEFEIYDFSSDSWRVLDGVIYNWYFHRSNGVSLKGNTYWRSSGGDDEFILSFDFTTERFRRVSLPFRSDGYRDSVWTVVLSVVREQQLSVLIQNYRDEIQIWVTNNIDDANEVVWSVFLVVDCGRFMIHGDVMRRVESFVLDEDRKVAICFSRDWESVKRTRIHIIGEYIVEQVYEEREDRWDNGSLLSYVPSLVHIQKNTPKHTEPLLLGNVPSLVSLISYLVSSSFSFWSRSFWARLVSILLFLLFAFAFKIVSVE